MAASPDTIRKRWCEILAQAHEAHFVDRRTLRIGAHCCFSQIGKDLSRYSQAVQRIVLLQLLKDPVCEPPGAGVGVVMDELVRCIAEGKYEEGARRIAEYLGVPEPPSGELALAL